MTGFLNDQPFPDWRSDDLAFDRGRTKFSDFPRTPWHEPRDRTTRPDERWSVSDVTACRSIGDPVFLDTKLRN
jgi:hypothetical protein